MIGTIAPQFLVDVEEEEDVVMVGEVATNDLFNLILMIKIY